MRKKNSPEADNALVKELREVEFIKQPYLYAMIGADFTLVQRSIMIEIMNSLQARFNAFLKHSKTMDETGQLSLFTEEERHEKIKTFRISAASLGIKPSEYEELEEACANLIRMNFSYMKYDKTTDTFRRTYANLFSSIAMPSMVNPDYKYKNEDKKRRMNYIEARMDVDVLEYLCDLNNGQGYMDHIYRIARISRRKRTPSIYIYLARWAKDFPKKAVNYVELKKFLGVITLEQDRDDKGKPIDREVDKYPKFSKFCKEVMEPIKKDLDRLAEDNQVDFTFEYEPVYKTAVKRGDPEDILFHIRLSRLGEELRKQRKSLQAPADIWTLLRSEFRFTSSDIKSLSDMLPAELTEPFRMEVMALMERIKRYKPKNKKSYAITALRNYILQQTPEADAEEVIEKSDEGREGELPLQSEDKTFAPSVSKEDEQRWMQFMEELKGKVSSHDFHTWMECLQMESYQGNTLTLLAPNRFVISRLEENFIVPVSEAIRTVFGANTELAYRSANK